MKQKILITGGTGFLGRRLAIKLKDEFNVIISGRNNKQNVSSSQFTGCKAIPMDISNIESVRDAIVDIRPDIIIHAAATKFVDLAEKEPMECIDVNITGSQNIARVAVDKGVGVVIGISTDKAAPPVRNTYGLSKATMERIFCSMNSKTKTKFTCVRYGNVAWSTGSVLPIWKKMYEKTNLIGTTGPEMRRFFFTVEEAVDLVLNALNNIEITQGKVLSREMKSAKISDILRIWTERIGGKWEHIEGRPGERNDEFLIGDTELDYTRNLKINGINHYLISFNEKEKECLPNVLSSANASRLTDDEIFDLISNPPIEEK